MTVPVWQPGTLYQPGEVVQASSVGAVVQTPIDNADFEAGSSDWTLSSGVLTIGAAAQVYNGTKGLTFSPTFSVLYSETATSDTEADISEGQTVRAQCKYRGGDKNIDVTLQLRWLDSGSSLVSAVNGTTRSGGGNGWNDLVVEGVAPEGVAYVQVRLLVNVPDSDAATDMYFDAFSWNQAYQQIPNGLIFRATQAAEGYSDVNEPTWPTSVSGTVNDNEVTWTAEEGNSVVWRAKPILQSDTSEPTFPAANHGTVEDNTILWEASDLRVTDENCPNSKQVLILSSKVYAADDDIIPYSATVNPLDWTTAEDAGYIPFGLNTYGSQPVSALSTYRSNLVAFNSKAFQMWQVDEDPANFALLDAVPVGSPYYKSSSPVNNDLVFLTEEGIRNMGIAGASTNLEAGFFGKQIDPLVKAAIAGIGDEDDILSLYYPGAGQYWLIFEDEAFVLTMNGGKADMSWSRYTFPSAIDDWTIADTDLYLRSGTKVWKFDESATVDDAGGTDTEFLGRVYWPYLDFGALGVTKFLHGVHIVADGDFDISIGWDQKNDASFTSAYSVSGDTLTGDIIPFPLAAPSFKLRLDFDGDQSWEWSASALYMDDFRRTS